MLRPNLFSSIFLLRVLAVAALVFTSILLEAKELKVGISSFDYPPFYMEENERLFGASIEIARLVSKKLGHKIIFVRQPWKRVQYNLKSGKIDMVILYFKSRLRAKDVYYTNYPYIFESSYLFVKKNSNIQYKGDLSSLEKYKFGSISGYSHGREYDHSTKLKKIKVNNEVSLLKMLVHGRFDIGIGNKYTIKGHAAKLGLENKIKFLEPAMHVAPNYMAFSKKNKASKKLASQYSIQLERFMRTKEYASILSKYGFAVLGLK